MGCHLYLYEIEGNIEVPSHIGTVPNLGIWKLTKKEDVASLLNFCRLKDESNLLKANSCLKSISIDKNVNVTVLCKAIVIHYCWSNNVGYNQRLKENGLIEAVKGMLLFEIERITSFMWNKERIYSFLNKFIEGVHYAITL